MHRRLIRAFTFVALPLTAALGAMPAVRVGRGTDQVHTSRGAEPRAAIASQSGYADACRAW